MMIDTSAHAGHPVHPAHPGHPGHPGYTVPVIESFLQAECITDSGFSIMALIIGSEGDTILLLIVGQNWKHDSARSCFIPKILKHSVLRAKNYIFGGKKLSGARGEGETPSEVFVPFMGRGPH